MAKRRLPPRYKTGPLKGRFRPRGTSGKRYSRKVTGHNPRKSRRKAARKRARMSKAEVLALRMHFAPARIAGIMAAKQAKRKARLAREQMDRLRGVPLIGGTAYGMNRGKRRKSRKTKSRRRRNPTGFPFSGHYYRPRRSVGRRVGAGRKGRALVSRKTRRQHALAAMYSNPRKRRKARRGKRRGRRHARRRNTGYARPSVKWNRRRRANRGSRRRNTGRRHARRSRRGWLSNPGRSVGSGFVPANKKDAAVGIVGVTLGVSAAYKLPDMLNAYLPASVSQYTNNGWGYVGTTGAVTLTAAFACKKLPVLKKSPILAWGVLLGGGFVTLVRALQMAAPAQASQYLPNIGRPAPPAAVLAAQAMAMAQARAAAGLPAPAMNDYMMRDYMMRDYFTQGGSPTTSALDASKESFN